MRLLPGPSCTSRPLATLAMLVARGPLCPFCQRPKDECRSGGAARLAGAAEVRPLRTKAVVVNRLAGRRRALAAATAALAPKR